MKKRPLAIKLCPNLWKIIRTTAKEQSTSTAHYIAKLVSKDLNIQLNENYEVNDADCDAIMIKILESAIKEKQSQIQSLEERRLKIQENGG